MELQDWRAVAASVIGTSHTKALTPCQDCHAFDLIKSQEEVLVMIASDGAGSASKSEMGSDIACRELLENIRGFFEDGHVLSDVTRDVAQSWLENAAATVAFAADREGLAVREFACTLVAALVSPTSSAFLQVGDGAIVVRPRGDDWTYVFWPQHGEYINTTVFITDPIALSRFEFQSGADVVDEVAVFSDGIEALVLHYASQTVHSPFFDGVFPAVRALPSPGLNAELSSQLAAYLGSPAICDRTDDDKTLLLASRLKRPPSRALVTTE